METPLIEMHRAAGARLAEVNGCMLPEGFSEFDKEYRAARETIALFDTNWHAIFTLAGRDRVKYLHAVSSNDIKSLADGQGTLALLLNPQGRILAELAVYALPEKLLVLSHASLREHTLATLKKYIIGSQVVIEDLTDKLASVAVEGPRALEAAQETLGAEVGDLTETSIREIIVYSVPCYVLRRPHFGNPSVELLAQRDVLSALWDKLLTTVRAHGGEPIGMRTLNSLRLEAGMPWFPVDFNDGMIPQEAAIEGTHISFNKGCYTGQEIVERVRSRGHVNRKRLPVKFSTEMAPPSGTKLRAGDTEVGFVTSAAYSPASGRAIGMGYVRREHFAPGSILEFEGGTAEVQ
jgi:folate-binding protein YgfZ